ncbi:MAG: hypothetical protein ACI9U2_000615 [Bradymonadia bacterium]|jgi:hypothetical protein
MLTLLCAVAAACTPPTAADDKSVDSTPKGPPARVDLPPMITLEGSLPPETHADQTMRIDGLLARKAKHLGQKVVVRGHVISKYECPKGKKCQHRVWLADAPAGGDKKLVLANLSEALSDLLEVGEQYVVSGKFDRKSPDGFVRSAGLLIYEQIEGVEDPAAKEREKDRRKRTRFRRRRR